jgi:hypothetical protein
MLKGWRMAGLLLLEEKRLWGGGHVAVAGWGEAVV